MSRDITVFLYSCTEPHASSVLLPEAASRFSGGGVDQWKLSRSEKGKPFFINRPDICFSVSHSGAYWACAFGFIPLGLDIQQHTPCSISAISERFFHPEEAAWLAQRHYAPDDFFRIWAIKESYLKFTGDGITAGLDGFSVLQPLPGNVQAHSLTCPTGYSMCVCALDPGEITCIEV